MKKSLLYLVFSFATIAGFGQAKKFQDLIGKWEITGEQQSGASLEVIDSANLYITYMGEKKKILDYKIDFSKSPHWLDFTIQDTSGVIAVKSLFEIMNDSVIKWQLFLADDRTTHFTAKNGELYYLKKARKESPVLSSNDE